jgi:PAS domain S-box-containing protein
MKKKILIVDDNKTNLYLLKSILEEEGLEVVAAENGKDALDRAHAHPPDLIVSDILMPVMDGYALCRRCKSDETLKDIPFVFYTATYTEQKDEKFALSLGADRFVLKPQEPETLIQILEEVWEERSEAGAVAPKPLGEEMEFFRQHNEILFSKLEKKMLELEKANRKLKCLEEQYRLSFENVTDIVWTIDANLIFQKMSPSVEKMLGYNPKDFIGRSIVDLVKILAPESMERAMTEIGSVLGGQTIQASVYTFVARDGTLKVGEISGSPIFRNKEIVGMVCVTRDITERIRAEEKVKQSEKKYRELFDFLPIPVYEMDFEARLVSANRAIYETFRGTEEDLKRDPRAWQILSPEDIDQSRKNIERLLKGEKVEGTEYNLKRLDGSVFPAIVISSVIYSEGTPVGLRGAVVDITERKLAEKALRNTQELLNEVGRIGKIGGWEMDLINRKATWTKATYDIVEIEPSQSIPGLDEHVDYYLPEFRPLVAEAMRALIEEDKPLDFEAKLLTANGNVKWCRAMGRSSHKDGKVVKVYGTFQDITERKRSEEALESERNLLRNLIDNVPDRIYAKDRESRFIIINEAMVRRMGKTSMTDIIGKSDFDLLPLEMAQRFYDDEQAIIQSGKSIINREEPLPIEGDKIRRWNLATKVPLRDSHGNTIGIVGVGREITELKRAEEALRESEEKFRSLFEHLQDAILLTRPDGSILEINQAGCEMFGMSADEIRALGRNGLVDVTDPSLHAALDERAGRGVARAEITMIRANGEKFPVDITSTIFTDINGQQKTSMIIRDITERKQAEEALQESEKRYRSVFENHAAVKLLIDPETGIIIEANEAAVHYYGWSHEQLKQMKIQEINMLPPEDVKKEIERARTDNQIRFEFRHRRADGSIRDVEVFSSKITTRGKDLLHSIIHDITERKQAEDALRKSEARFRSYFELPLIGIAITSPEKGWLEGNSRLSDILGYSWQELKDMTWSELTHPEDLAVDVEQFNRVLAGEIDSYVIDKRFIRKDGRVIWTSLAAGCVRKQDGTADYFVALFEDITERKESIKKLRRSLEATVQAIAVTVETRDPYTAGHQRRVADLAQAIAVEMNLSSDQIDGMRMAGIIHDLGKLSVPAEILSRPTKLTDIEFALIKTHPQSGYDILKDMDFPWPIARMVLEHHERMNGSGYPNRLTGDKLLIESRILMVADVVEAMASHRPYRPALGLDAALNEIEKNRGIIYDTAVADACLRLFKEKNYQLAAA